MLAFIRALFLSIGIAFAVATAVLAWDYLNFVSVPFPLEKQRVVELERGSNLYQLSGKLMQQGLITNPRHREYMIWQARLSGGADQLKAGEYMLRPGMSPVDFIADLVAGKVHQYGITVVEGWTFKRLQAAVDAHKAIKHELKGADHAEIMSAIGAEGKHPEGQFLPDTYFFPVDTTDTDFYKRAYEAMQTVLMEQWRKRDADLPLEVPYDALILASIVERETAVPAERAQIAGVFVRRLKLGMALQTDPTVIYGMGERFDGDIRSRDLVEDTPYNTYTRTGLPPTPIALPGEASIAAVMHPADGKSLYFVSRGDGSHVFSETLEEHEKAVQKYQLNN